MNQVSTVATVLGLSGILFSCEAFQNPNDPSSPAYKWQTSARPNVEVVGQSPIAGASAGSWLGPVTVRIDAPAGSTISYTLDGSVPTSANGTQVLLGSTETSSVLAPSNASFTLKAISTEVGKAPSSEVDRSFVVYPLIHAWDFNDGDSIWASAGGSAPFITLTLQSGMLHGVWTANTDPRLYSELHETNPIDIANLHFIDMNWRSDMPNGAISFFIYTVKNGLGTYLNPSELKFPAPAVAPTTMTERLFDITDTTYNSSSVAAMWRPCNLQQLRIDPTQTTTGFVNGQTFDIDYIRFYGDAQ